MIVWISRDHEDNDSRTGPSVEIWPKRRPTWRLGLNNHGFYDGDVMVSCCLDAFEQTTGIHLEPGELRQVDLVMKTLTIKPEELHASESK